MSTTTITTMRSRSTTVADDKKETALFDLAPLCKILYENLDNQSIGMWCSRRIFRFMVLDRTSDVSPWTHWHRNSSRHRNHRSTEHLRNVVREPTNIMIQIISTTPESIPCFFLEHAGITHASRFRWLGFAARSSTTSLDEFLFRCGSEQDHATCPTTDSVRKIHHPLWAVIDETGLDDKSIRFGYRRLMPVLFQ